MQENNELLPLPDDDVVDPLKQVAAETSLSIAALRRAIKQRRLKATRLSARRIGIRRKHRREWLDAGAY